MSEIFLCGGAADATVLSNVFIDEYLKDANDAQLKVYLFLVRRLQLSVLGLMLYLQIFEAHARYLYTFVPIFVFLATEGIDNLREYLNQKSERRVKK